MCKRKTKSQLLKKLAKKHGLKVIDLKLAKSKPVDLRGYMRPPGVPGMGKTESWATPKSWSMVDDFVKNHKGTLRPIGLLHRIIDNKTEDDKIMNILYSQSILKNPLWVWDIK